MVTSNNYSVHDLIMVDCEYLLLNISLNELLSRDAAPEFHLVIQQGSNGEIYNLAIRGTNLGGSDGVDVWGKPHTSTI